MAKDPKYYLDAEIGWSPLEQDSYAKEDLKEMAQERVRRKLEEGRVKGRYYEAGPIKKINAFVGSGNLGGLFYPNRPDEVFLNAASNRNLVGTYEHETQHAKDKKYDYLEKYLSKFGPEGSENRKKAEDWINYKKESTKAKYGRDLTLSNDYTDEGFFANLVSQDKLQPVGQSLFDTELGKDLFDDDPTLKAIYLRATQPTNTTQISAGIEKDFIPKYKGPSIRQRATQALRKFMSK